MLELCEIYFKGQIYEKVQKAGLHAMPTACDIKMTPIGLPGNCRKLVMQLILPMLRSWSASWKVTISTLTII